MGPSELFEMVKDFSDELPVKFSRPSPDFWIVAGENAWEVKPISYRHPPEVVSVEVAQYIIAGFVKAKIGDVYGGTRNYGNGWECWLRREEGGLAFWSTNRKPTEFEAIVAAYQRWCGRGPGATELATDGPLGTPYTRPSPEQ